MGRFVFSTQSLPLSFILISSAVLAQDSIAPDAIAQDAL